jgi:hypothetical protein
VQYGAYYQSQMFLYGCTPVGTYSISVLKLRFSYSSAPPQGHTGGAVHSPYIK